MLHQLRIRPAIGLCLLTLLAFVPLMPAMPQGGLDPASVLGLAAAPAQAASTVIAEMDVAVNAPVELP